MGESVVRLLSRNGETSVDTVRALQYSYAVLHML